MKQFFLFFAVVMAVALTNCNKNDDLSSINQQPVNVLKHSSTPIPFNGSITGLCTTVAGTCGPGWVGRHMEGKGNITHMGKVSVVLDYCMKLTYPSIDPTYDGIFNGPGVIVAANGDELNAFMVGNITFVFNEQNVIIGGNIEASASIFGGTGRFEGANGFIDGAGYMDFTGAGGIMGTEIPMSFNIWGFINYGSEYFDVTISGTQTATGSCEGGGNSYSQTGTGTGTMGNIDAEMEYCTHTEILPTPTPYPFPLPAGTPIGGTNEGTGYLEESANAQNWLSSEVASDYRFTFVPGSPMMIINDSYSIGEILDGGGVYEGASGKFIAVGTQSFAFPNPNGATGTMRCIGYVTY